MTDGLKNRLARQTPLIGEEGCERLAAAHVIVIGVGGVGGYAAEAIARMGVGRITLVDHDEVSESNINRQIIATVSTVGRKKVEVMAERIRDINPDCAVTALPQFVTGDGAAALLAETDADAIVDAVDNTTAKLALICAAKEQGRYICSSVGTGNRLDGTALRVGDIYATKGGGLARVMRKELRKRGIESCEVVYSDEVRVVGGLRTPPSVVYVPAIAGMMIAERIVRRIIYGRDR